jgi:hypothetical protein
MDEHGEQRSESQTDEVPTRDLGTARTLAVDREPGMGSAAEGLLELDGQGNRDLASVEAWLGQHPAP